MGYLLQNGGLGMAGDWIITGGRPLQGRVEVPAAKNSVLPLLAASLLCSGPVRLQNVPRLTDVEDCLVLLRGVGCTAGWQGAELVVQGQPMRTDLAPEAAGRMRASILFCAPLLARLGRVSTVLPGGCRIGARPIDLHLQGLAQMGVRQLPAAPGQLTLYAPAGCGAQRSVLPSPVWALPRRCCWPPPRRRDRPCCMALQKSRRSRILPPSSTPAAAAWRAQAPTPSGCRKALPCGLHLHAGGRPHHRLYAGLRGSSGGRQGRTGGLRTRAVCPAAGNSGTNGLHRRAGTRCCRHFAVRDTAWRGKRAHSTLPGPCHGRRPAAGGGDALRTGESCLQDRVFENRFACAEGFAALGANVRVAERTLYVQPGGTLRGAKLTAPDLRGGAALALAALAARGSSRLGGVEFVRRGYADLDRLLAGLGAQIWQEIPARSGVVKKTPTKKQFCLAIGAKK